jgi:hypothetical protein
MKGTPLMSTSKVPDLTMTHADSLHYQPTQGCGNFVYKILVLGHQKAQVEQIHVWNIDKDFIVHELTPVLHRRSTVFFFKVILVGYYNSTLDFCWYSSCIYIFSLYLISYRISRLLNLNRSLLMFYYLRE